MFVAPADFIDLYVFTPGRILFAVNEVKKRAEERALASISAACDKSLEAARHNLKTENAWARTKTVATARGEGEARIIDPMLDRAVSGLQDSATTLARSLAPENDLVKIATEFLKKALPGGASAITALPFEDELAAVKELHGRLVNPSDLQPHVAKLSLQPYVDELGRLAGDFEKALRSGAKVEVSYGEVKASSASAQDWLLALVLKIGGMYSDPTPEHAEGRSYLLEPIMDQDQRIAAIRRRRQPITDIDPTTGEEQPSQPPVVPPVVPEA